MAPLLPPPFSKTENRGGLLCFSDRGGDDGSLDLDPA
jgi:hypothetical protein